MPVEPAGHVDSYEPFFGLREPAFSLAPNARFRFASASHSAALAQVAAAIERREPLVVVTGDIGTGKTLLCRTMLQELPRKTFLSVVDDPMLGRDDLLTQLLQDFGVMSKDRVGAAPSRHALVETLHAFLRSLAPIGAHAVVIVDEAQHLQPDVLEQIRLLSNVDDGQGTLLQMMLVGQSDLEPLLSRPELRQLAQRVSRRVRLEPLNADEVRQYIEHRLAIARAVKPTAPPGALELAQALTEWSGPEPSVEFTPDAIDAIARRSSGLPRVINLLCDRALAAAYHVRLRTIGAPLIETAGDSLTPSGIAAAAAVPVGSVSQKAASIEAPPPVPLQAAAPDAALEANAVTDRDAWIEQLAQPLQTVHDETPADAVAAPPADTPASAKSMRYVWPAAAAVIAAAAIWLGLNFMRSPSTPPGRPEAAKPAKTAAPAPRPTATPPATPSETQPAAASQTAPPAPAPEAAAVKPTTASAAAAAGPTAGTRFDVVVASFRTESRATTVSTAVKALNLPVRQRVSDGWQQVVVGPFASRAEAESARERLDHAGLTGAQIVPNDQ